MSQEEQISRREKKELRDAARQKKGKKRKVDDIENGNDDDAIEPVIEGAIVEKEAAPKKSKKSKKRKADADEQATDSKQPQKSKKRKADAVDENDDATDAVDGAEPEVPSRPKKRTKSKKAQTDGETAEAQSTDATEKSTKSRFIVFVGNLPYKTTDDSLRKHFQKLEPFTLRHRMEKDTKKSKGFAFLEFENYDRMKTCLKLYHHSMFDPTEKDDEPAATKGKGKHARKINVELTSGGGGNTEGRKDKIKAKNVRLEEQRKRRAELEKKEKAKKEAKEAKNGAKDGKVKKAAAAEEKIAEVPEDSHGMHPSRLARLTG